MESLEDIWKVSRLQRERKQKEERERLARLEVCCRWECGADGRQVAGGLPACRLRCVAAMPAVCVGDPG